MRHLVEGLELLKYANYGPSHEAYRCLMILLSMSTQGNNPRPLSTT